MKRWVVAIALAVSGCQTATSTSTTEQAIEDCFGTANFCNASRPPTPSWSAGDPFPQSTPDTVVVLMRMSPNVWHAYGADPKIGQVLWGRSIKPAAMGPWMQLVGSQINAYGGVRGPINPVCPPECGDPLPSYLIAAAMRIAPISDAARADAAACFPDKP